MGGIGHSYHANAYLDFVDNRDNDFIRQENGPHPVIKKRGDPKESPRVLLSMQR
jgi:hypothetical protein